MTREVKGDMSTTPQFPQDIQREIDELTLSIAGLRETMGKLRPPLEESHQKVPQATTQLDKISEQTQAAAHKMLDSIEAISHRGEQIGKELGELGSLARASSMHEITCRVHKIAEMNQQNVDASFELMDALQFQDITSQQMNYAASLLEEIEGKLQHILQVVGGTAPEITARKQRAFDPHADLFEKLTNQDEIDSIVARKEHG